MKSIAHRMPDIGDIKKAELADGVNDAQNKIKEIKNDLPYQFDTHINEGKQGKHITGHNNYIEGRSIFNGDINDAQALIDDFAGTGTKIGGNKERVDFGRIIGQYCSPETGELIDTTVGIIHYSKSGTHIVLAQPIY